MSQGRSEGAQSGDDAADDEPAPPSVDLANLKERGRTYYRGGNYEAAAEVFAQIVAADPDDELARDYLELARERVRLGDGTQRTDAFAATEVEPTSDTETPTAEITVYFDAPAGKGTMDFTLDEEQLPTWSFSVRKVERLKHRFEVQPGRHTLEVQLRYGKRSCGKMFFDEDFGANSRWTLRVSLASKEEHATAYLVERHD